MSRPSPTPHAPPGFDEVQVMLVYKKIFYCKSNELKQKTCSFQFVMGPGQFFVARAGSAVFGWGLVWKINYKIPEFFYFSPSDPKKISPGWVKNYPGQRPVGLLFTPGQKYSWVRSGQGPSLVSMNPIHL